VLVLDELAPVLGGPVLDLEVLLAFRLLLPKLILGSFLAKRNKNIIK